MNIEEHVPLKSLTTFRVGGSARFVAYCENEVDLHDAITFAKERELSFFVLGGGSNMLGSDMGYEGVIIRPLFEEVVFEEEEESVLVTAGANVVWDMLVHEVAARGLWGIENLAGIPGSVGAAPVQNIGAYGTELSETLEFVDAYDVRTDTRIRLTASECELGYRDGRFKREPHLIILRVALRLLVSGTPKTTYKDLALYATEHPLNTPEEVGEAVRAIRSKKFPDLREYGTAGSFFKNPVISSDEYDSLIKRYPGLPGFPSDKGVKISLAWLLDNVLSLRGFTIGHVRLFEQQPLVVVADTDASATEVHALADTVAKRVKEATGITLEREVRTLPEK